ncbi:hypothetical protein [Candidatus Spongiihabitans sp.]|uniref:hypothetical protein n=1 Tax=Candidatus Spongiihabitans sp. TaxID=3101308 RepID=UPI003C6F286A
MKWMETNCLQQQLKIWFSMIHAEPEPVNREGMVDYMLQWDKWTRVDGATNQWILEHEVRADNNGIITDWEWWELVGTDICGMAFVKTSDCGVFLEGITYFDRELRRRKSVPMLRLRTIKP